MGCFFGCFRVQDDNRRPSVHLLSQPISSNPKVPIETVSRNRLSSLLLSEAEDRDQVPQKDTKSGVLGSAAHDIDFSELKAEAKFLKACGTLPQTPAEIRNNEKPTDSGSRNGNTEYPAYHSWLQTASIEKLKLEKQTDQLPSPAKLFEEWENGSDSSSLSPDSCVTGQNSEGLYPSATEGHRVRHDVEINNKHADLGQNPTAAFTPLIPETQCRKKSVHFDCDNDAVSISCNSASSAVTCQEPKPSELLGDYSASKPSPCPTLPTLTNDMQTPGTAYPAYLHNKEIGKNTRIRSQYVYSVLNPVENATQFKEMIKESFTSDDYSVHLEEQPERGAMPTGKELNVDTSLSSWLPPKQFNQGSNNRPFIAKTPGERPILGMVAAHWNTDEAVTSPPKWWDGNGIPNSTNKYKEDQKVSWHATPFEERLEKALSEDKLLAERKQLGKMTLPPIGLDEKEERQSVSHFESGFILVNSS
uniref:protein JASON n=1 Tax=Erigeron canadensis TaxID=72917 RepID=UPI001CB9CD31|nr:protein JASON [Erigeron canadensis]